MKIGSYILALITCILLYGSSIALAGVPPVPDTDKGFDDPIPQGEFDELFIPLKRVQNLFLVEARVDSLIGNFILDTGAPHLVLNKTYFTEGRKAEGEGVSYGITGGGNTILNTTIDSLIITDLFYTNVDADIVNLGHLEDARGVKILGLLGASLFKEVEMEIDYRNNLLILYKLDKEGNRIVGNERTQLPDVDVSIDITNDIIFMDVVAAEKKLRFCLDTGAERNVISNTLSNKIIKHFQLTTPGGLTGSNGNSQLILNGQMDSVIIGGKSFVAMPFILTNLNYLQLVYDTNINGILGYDYLSKGIVTINHKKKRLTMYFYTAIKTE
ncbi:MAG TPA: pepsin/retropepsin-like aspartic protease family protein [Chitinophagales bacterium]|nr:pepsin/retropepsin-like aspartic protease family protein [Chitinophagales bacterium]HRG84577.1 pepsin/retropepsin-like aspartic protease family protein [Chitinophagales bacterium]HRH53252.1 pepsin/retropepsin-like aspartic protease family protein [Chitinophagales bacterium]